MNRPDPESSYMSPEQASGKRSTCAPISSRWGWYCTRWPPVAAVHRTDVGRGVRRHSESRARSGHGVESRDSGRARGASSTRRWRRTVGCATRVLFDRLLEVACDLDPLSVSISHRLVEKQAIRFRILGGPLRQAFPLGAAQPYLQLRWDWDPSSALDTYQRAGHSPTTGALPGAVSSSSSALSAAAFVRGTVSPRRHEIQHPEHRVGAGYSRVAEREDRGQCPVLRAEVRPGDRAVSTNAGVGRTLRPGARSAVDHLPSKGNASRRLSRPSAISLTHRTGGGRLVGRCVCGQRPAGGGTSNCWTR